MKPICCVIVDDEQPAIDVLTHYVGKTTFLNLAFTTVNPLEALDFLRQRTAGGQPVDLVFLDIHMPQLSGIEFLRLVGKHHQFIMTTAGEYALAGFEHAVIDYLMKPIAFDRFLKAVQRVTVASQSSVVVEAPSVGSVLDFLLVKAESRERLVKINVGDIVYAEGLRKYVSIYTENECIIIQLTIGELAEQLSHEQFLRVHKSCIVAIDRINAVDGNQIFLKGMRAKNPAVPLGVTYRKAVFELLDRRRGKSTG